MLAICAADKPMVFKAPKTSPKAERVSQGTKTGAQTRHRKPLTYSKQSSMSSKEVTKCGSSKAPTGSKTGHSKKRKESSLAIDSNLSQPPVSTPVDIGMHKEDQQATGGLTSSGVTSEERANPQLSSGMSAFNLNKPIFLASFIIHSESASGCDALADSTAEADPGLSAPNDSIPQQQGMDKGTKNTSFDHISVGTDPYVLADQTKSISDGLETVLKQPITRKETRSFSRQVEEEEASSIIKLDDLAKLVSNVQPSFKDLDSPENDPIIVVDDSDEDEEIEKDEVHTTTNAETEDTSVPKSTSPRSSQIQELTNQVLILQSHKHKMELEKNKAEVEAALLKAQPSFPNILSAHDFSSSLPTELKDLPSKFNELTEEVKGLKKQVHELEIELPGAQVASVQAKLKTLDDLPSLLLNVTKALNKFAQVLDSASSKAEDQSVPSVGQANTMPADGEKNTNQATISQLFQKRAGKNAEKENLNNQQQKVPPIITTTIQMQTPVQNLPKSSSQPEGEHIKKDKGKKAIIKKLKRFDLITKDGRHIHISEDQINHQKKLKEDAKAEATKKEGKVRKAELVDLLGPEVVNKYCNDKLHEQDPLDKLNDLANKKRKHANDIHDYFKANKRLKSSIQYEDHLPGTVLNKPVLGMIMFNSYHRQDFVTIKNLKDFSNTMQYTIQEIFRRHQGPGLDDHARTFSSLLLVEVDNRNLNPLKQMRTIKHLRHYHFDLLKFLQLQLFRSLEDWEVSSLQFMQRAGKDFLCQKGMKESPGKKVLLPLVI
ncbi:hypothetical protein Tco_0574039 [Tanacetum coccineum]